MAEKLAQEATQAEDQASSENEQQEGQQEGQQGALDTEAALAELKKARREAASYRTKLRKLEQAEDERKKAQMTEAERIKAELAEAQSRAAEAEQRATETMLRMSVVAAAAKANFNDPADAWRMIDLAALEVDEDGTVAGVDEAVATLLKDKPYLAKVQGSITPTNPPSGSQQETDEERRARLFGARRSGFWEGSGVMPFKTD